MASLLCLVGRPQVEAGAVSDLRPQGHGASLLLLCPALCLGGSLAPLTQTQGLEVRPPLVWGPCPRHLSTCCYAHSSKPGMGTS